MCNVELVTFGDIKAGDTIDCGHLLHVLDVEHGPGINGPVAHIKVRPEHASSSAYVEHRRISDRCFRRMAGA